MQRVDSEGGGQMKLTDLGWESQEVTEGKHLLSCFERNWNGWNACASCDEDCGIVGEWLDQQGLSHWP
jgi:hypothetical protein